MAEPQNLLTFSLLTCLLNFVASSFDPPDHYLISCGSSFPSVLDPYNRMFSAESSLSDSVKLTATRTVSLTDSTPAQRLYNSSRIFTRPLSYEFVIKERGAHLVRLHFRKFDFGKFDVKDAKFHVLADGYLLLNDFSGVNLRNDVEIREFVLWVDSDTLELAFVPSEKSNFGFVNAIEVISAPNDLILDIAHVVDSNGVSKIDGLSKNGFETVFRVNVGGPKITPFNDTLWRTWVTDEEFLKSSDELKEIRFSGRIQYRNGGASREVAPDHVYGSARAISASGSSISKQKLTWEFPAVEGYKYLVRTHFCDIASASLGSLIFNVFVNGNLAYENLDLSRITLTLASPFYTDFVVDRGNTGVITVSVGAANWSSPSGVDAILNGVEVFKLSNSMNSFDGMVSAESLVSGCHGENGSLLVSLAAAVGLLVAASVLLRKRLIAVRDSVAWSRLPVDVSEVSLKSNYQ